MKNKNPLKQILLFGFLCMLPALSKAQAFFPYILNNFHPGCTMEVRWEVFCNTCLGGVPQSNPTQFIPAGGSVAIPAPVFALACGGLGSWTPTNTEVRVTVIGINGTRLGTVPITLPIVESSSPSFSAPSGYPCVLGGALNVDWFPTNTDIW